MDGRSEGSEPLTVDDSARRWASKDILVRGRGQQKTIEILPDDALLDVFDFYVNEEVHYGMNQDFERSKKQRMEVWIRLAHVCRRWRSVVLQSPHRLDLRLACTPFTPTRDLLDIWPPLPLVICDYYIPDPRPFLEDNIIAALEHNDRVSEIQLIHPQSGYFPNSEAILKPFPELTLLQLSNYDIGADDEWEPELPDSFLGGSAPRLQAIYLEQIVFPGLPKLLMSTTRLVCLELTWIPYSGYTDIPPEEMATGLSALTSLESLIITFLYPSPMEYLCLRPPPLPHSTLPNLTEFKFSGKTEYLDVILARIDAPRVHK